MVIAQILADLVIALGSSLDPGFSEASQGPDFPFTYLRGHPSFPGPQMRVSGPYRIVVAKDRFQHTGERRRKVIFQLPDELLQNIRGQGDERLVIRVGDGNDWVDIEFYPTGLTKRRDMKRLIEAARERVAGNQRRLRA